MSYCYTPFQYLYLATLIVMWKGHGLGMCKADHRCTGVACVHELLTSD